MPPLRFTLLAALASFVAACDQGPVAPTDLAPQLDYVPYGHTVQVCKVGPAGTYAFTISATGGDLPLGSEFTVDAGSCVVPWVALDDQSESITVTEVDDANLDRVEVSSGPGASYFVSTESQVTFTADSYNGAMVVYYNNPGVAEGRMTGGGYQIRVDGVRVTRGLTLHCDVTLSNNLEINWPGGNNWHLQKESLESVLCIDDPAYDPVPPDAPFDTFIARALGSLNGVENSIIDFKFIDDGEPGRTDEAHFTVYAPNMGPGQVAPGDEMIVLEVGGQLDGGNLQAHYDQPHS
jgi:hypothetical protein